MPWEYPDSALITLCPKCHKKEHEGKNIMEYTKKNAKLNGLIKKGEESKGVYKTRKVVGGKAKKKKDKAQPARKNSYEEVKAYLANPTPKKKGKPQAKPYNDREWAKKRVQKRIAAGKWLADTKKIQMERGVYPQRLPE